jgi:hypothetical protein
MTIIYCMLITAVVGTFMMCHEIKTMVDRKVEQQQATTKVPNES